MSGIFWLGKEKKQLAAVSVGSEQVEVGQSHCGRSIVFQLGKRKKKERTEGKKKKGQAHWLVRRDLKMLDAQVIVHKTWVGGCGLWDNEQDERSTLTAVPSRLISIGWEGGELVCVCLSMFLRHFSVFSCFFAFFSSFRLTDLTWPSLPFIAGSAH